jgi:ABC-2 type transport system permease protein
MSEIVQRTAGRDLTGGAAARQRSGNSILLPVWGLFAREVLRFVRQPGRVLGSLGTPLLFWLLLGSGFGKTFQPPGMAGGMNYGTYFFPGTVLLVVLFTAIFASISVIQDRTEGFLQGVLVAPVPRLAIVLGKVLGGTTLGFVQGLIMLLLAPLAGLSFTLPGFLGACGALFLTALSLSALGFLFAWRMNSVQSFHAVMNLLLMPMWLLSGAFFSAAGATWWIRAIMAANPLSYGLTALRGALHPAAERAALGVGDPWLAAGVVAAFSVAMLLGAAWAASRPERG